MTSIHTITILIKYSKTFLSGIIHPEKRKAKMDTKKRLNKFFILCCALLALFFVCSICSVNAFAYSPTIFYNSQEKPLKKSNDNLSTLQSSENSVSTNSLVEGTDYNVDLGTKYSLYDFADYKGVSAGYKSNVGNQFMTDLCWAFAVNTSLESTIYKLGLSTQLNFSEVDLAYSVYILSRGKDRLGAGGFELAYEYLASGAGPVYENSDEAYGNNSSLRWDSNEMLANSYATYLQNNQRNISEFSVMEAKFFPSRDEIEKDNSLSDEEQISRIEDLRQSIKYHIKNYGAVTTSIYFDRTYLANSYVYSYTGNNQVNHMVTIVGWDDTFTHGDKKGAYIVQNSYGETFGKGGYFYVMYEDANIEDDVAGFKRVGLKQDNDFVYNSTELSEQKDQFVTLSGLNAFSTQFISATQGTSIFTANFFKTYGGSQIISSIKVPTVTSVGEDLSGIKRNNTPTNFKVYLINLQESDILNYEQALLDNFNDKVPIKNKLTGDYIFSSAQTGYYTIELDENLLVTGQNFVVVMEVLSGGALLFIDNNSNQAIPVPSFYTVYPNSSWSKYEMSGAECVLPIIVESLTIAQFDAEITGATCEYNGKIVKPSVEVYDDVNYSVSYSFDGKNYFSESEYNVKDVLANNEPYEIYVKLSAYGYQDRIEKVNITILPKKLTIIPNNLSKYYGDNDPILTYLLDGLVENEEPQRYGRLSRELGENVGTYKITRGNLQLLDYGLFKSSNYDIVFNDSKLFTIACRELKIEVINNQKIYGDSNSEFEYQIVNAVAGEEPIVKALITRQLGENVGSYEFALNGSPVIYDNGDFLARNYLVTLNSNIKFNILPRTIYIYPDKNQTKVYDEPMGNITFSYQNALETPKFLGGLSIGDVFDAGDYLITLGDLSLVSFESFNAKNYTLQMGEDVYFNISLGEIDWVNVKNNMYVKYDAKPHSVVVEANDDDIEILFARHNSDEYFDSLEYVDAGEYIIDVLFKKHNYYDKVMSATLRILPIDLTISPNESQSKTYGDSDNILFDYSGNLVGEIPSFSGKLGKEGNIEDVGTYLINVGNIALQDGENFKATNYNLIFDNQNNYTYTILKRDLVITPNQTSKHYDKNSNSDPNFTFKYSKLYFNDTLDFTGKLSRIKGENVGSYEITLGTLRLGKSLEKNYNLVLEKTYFEILPTDITITILDKTSYYGEINRDFKYTVSGNYVSGDNLNLQFSCLDSNGQEINNNTLKDESGYKITATYSNPNYNATIISGKYFIVYRTYLVKFIGFDGVSKTLEVEHFSTINTLPEGISSEILGYKFEGFQVNDEYMVDKLSSVIITKNTTLEMIFAPVNYKITYELNGGEFLQDVETEYNIESNFSLKSPVRTGYNFDGFYDNANFDGEKLQTLKGRVGDVVLYAKFDIKVYDVVLPSESEKYTLVGSNNIEFGKDYIFSVQLEQKYNKSYDNLTATVVYKSTGESELLDRVPVENSTGVNFVIKSVRGEFDVVLDNIELNRYNINFVVDGEVIKTISVLHGEALSSDKFPQIPEKPNYDNIQPYWSQNEIVSASDDTNIEAIYTPNIYKVTFVLNGNSYVVDVNYGETVNTNVLYENIDLNVFEYLNFDHSLSGIDKDTTINVTVGSNIYILYIVLAVVGVIVTVMIILSIIKRKKRNKFDWWVFGK